MVVMGYRSDHTYYQELWYDALNNGYFLPGVAETDTLLDAVPSRIYLVLRHTPTPTESSEIWMPIAMQLKRAAI